MTLSSLRPGRPARAALPVRPAGVLLLLLTLVLPASAHAGTSPQVLSVREGWRFRWGDSPLDARGVPAWAHEPREGADWAPMRALDMPPGRDGQSFVWLSIPLPEGDWAQPAMLLGSVNNAFELYVGGERVHVSGKLAPGGREDIEHLGWQLVRLPPGSPGRRALLRIQGTGASIGVGRELRVGEHHALFAHALRQAVGPFALGTFMIGLALVAALGALRSQRQVLVPLAVFSLGAGLLVTGMGGVPNLLWGAGHTWYLCQLVGAALIAPGLCAFVDGALLRGQRPWFRRVVQGLSALAALLVGATLVLPRTVPTLLPVFYVAAAGGMLLCVVLPAIEAARGDLDSRIFVGGMAALFATAVHTILRTAGIADSLGFMLHWGFLALTLSLLGILSRRSGAVLRALETHARTLEAREGEVRLLADELGRGAGALAGAVQQLRASSAQQNEGVGVQASSLAQAQAVVEELRQTSRLTEGRVRTLADATGHAEEVGKRGTAALTQALAGLEAIQAAVTESTARVGALEKRAREIAGIVDSVKALADQSNMLALNAAIEAVRSGEAGKGFSVVAREVRSLADQSIQATERIREVLSGVGTDIREAVQLSTHGEQQVRASLAQVGASAEQLRELAAFVASTDADVQHLSAAITQQDTGTEQLAVAIRGLSEQMRHTLEALEQTGTATRTVQQLADEMSTVAGRAHASPAPRA